MSDHEQHEKIERALERQAEAHFWLHGMEANYHKADPFRWHLNAFLKALHETPTMLKSALQNETGFPKWFRSRKETLRQDPLLSQLAKHRNFVVHHGMLLPNSKATIGITEGRGIKLGMSLPMDPLDDSDIGMRRYLYATRQMGDPLDILMPDEDSLPCVEREWRLPKLDGEVVELCATAWLRMAETIWETLQWLGTKDPKFSLDCRHATGGYRMKTYSREALLRWKDSDAAAQA